MRLEMRLGLLLLCWCQVFKNATSMASYGDPTDQELAYLDWAMGVHASFCHDISPFDLIDPFRHAFAQIVTSYCNHNTTACGLKKTADFLPEHVIFLDGFPKRKYGSVIFRFLVVLPHDSIPLPDEIPLRPLLSKQILSDALGIHFKELSGLLKWNLLSYERLPKYGPITEFMNVALIPIGFGAGLLMIFLAYWSTTISSHTFSFSEGWMVVGSTGGKNYALRRTMEIIAEQKRVEEYAFSVEAERQRFAIGGSSQSMDGDAVILNVSNLPGARGPAMAPHQQQRLTTTQHYESVDEEPAESPTGSAPSQKQHQMMPRPMSAASLLSVPGIVVTTEQGGDQHHHHQPSPSSPSSSSSDKRRGSRRLSAIQEAAAQRVRQHTFSLVGTSRKRRIKTGSIALSQFARNVQNRKSSATPQFVPKQTK